MNREIAAVFFQDQKCENCDSMVPVTTGTYIKLTEKFNWKCPRCGQLNNTKYDNIKGRTVIQSGPRPNMKDVMFVFPEVNKKIDTWKLWNRLKGENDD